MELESSLGFGLGWCSNIAFLVMVLTLRHGHYVTKKSESVIDVGFVDGNGFLRVLSKKKLRHAIIFIIDPLTF